MLILSLILISWLVFAQSCMRFRTADSKAIASFGAKGIVLTAHTAQMQGHHVHYVQTGADSLPTLYFVHGTPGSWNAFEPYLRDSLLRSRFRMISIDRPGFGYSDFGDAYPLPVQSKIMGPVLLQTKNNRPSILVGHSLGGPMILQLAIDYPSLADQLVIISGSIDPAAEKPEKWRPVLYKTFLNWLVPGAMRQSNKELWYLKTDLVEQAPLLKDIHCPVYFIHGRQDTWVPPMNVAYGERMLTGAARLDTLWLDGNHFIPWSKFTSIRDLLLQLPTQQ